MLYSKLRNKEKIEYTLRSYEDVLFELLASMFEEETEVENEFLEFYLISEGKCAIWKLKNKLIATHCEFVGNIDEYGVGVDLFCVTANGKSKTFKNWRESNEVVVIYNNKYRTRDLNLDRFADMFTQIDKSIENNIINSRFTRFVMANNETEKIQLENAIKNNKNGEPLVVVSSNILEDDMSAEQRTIDLTNVQAVDKIQYLSQLHTELITRFGNLYGMATCSSNKLAQLSKDEVNNGSCASFIIPLDRLKHRKEGFDRVNEIFGTNWKVDFSECWSLEYTRLTARAEKENAEIEQIEASIEDGVSEETESINDENAEMGVVENE